MSDWETTRQNCLRDLEKTRKIFSPTIKLLEKISSQLPKHQEIRKELEKQNNFLEKEIARLKKNQFEVAVIGLEKAGKSTLLNGWLGTDILPNLPERCTYTTTEIRSCTQESQRYQIEYYSASEFEDKFNQTKISLDVLIQKDVGNENSEFINLSKEIQDVENNKDQIHSYLDKPIKERHFLDLSEVKDDLKDAIANPGHARAVKRVRIYTPKLLDKKDVIFYDVPGFDSPIKLHKQQAIQQLAEVDAILYAKQFKNPSITGPEEEILDTNDINDPHIKLSDKIFVALTQCDSSSTKDEYDEILVKSKARWSEKRVKETRILPICAPLKIEEFNPDKKNKIRQDLQLLNGGNDGIEDLKKLVDTYIETERNLIVKNRCHKIVETLRKLADFVLQTGKIIHPESLDELEKSQRDIEDGVLMGWWADEWRHISEEFCIYFQESIRAKKTPDAKAENHKEISNFREKYIQIVTEIMDKVPSSKPERQAIIYQKQLGDEGKIDVSEGHLAIRKQIYLETINQLQQLTIELSEILWDSLKELINWIFNRLWCIPDVKSYLLNREESLEKLLLKTSLEALILRLARPTADIFLRYPRTLSNREKNVIFHYEKQIKVLDLFNHSDDGKIGQKGLLSYLTRGIFDPTCSSISEIAGKVGNKESVFSPPVSTLDEATKQINEDIKNFVFYMQNSVYYFAGLESFFHQELDKIGRKFPQLEEEKRLWQRVVFSAIRNGHPGIPVPNITNEIAAKRSCIENIHNLQSILSQ